MKNIVLRNPLTDKEKLQARRLIGHDFISSIGQIGTLISNGLPIVKSLKRIQYIGLALYYLQENEISLWNNSMKDSFSNQLVDITSLRAFMNELQCTYDGELIINVDRNMEFLACRPVLHIVLSNLIKNSLGKQKRDKRTLLYTEYTPNFPKKALFIPEGSRDYSEFMAFHVHDDGPAFSNNSSLTDRLTKCPEEGQRGFGLYFTGLAARLMRSPVNIISEDNKVIVSVYHPIYKEFQD